MTILNNTLQVDDHPLVEQLMPDEFGVFMTDLVRTFRPGLRVLLKDRHTRRTDSSWVPGFLPDTAAIREDDWQVASIPEELQDRRVEITGPPDRKMTINALNSGAKVFMADFEDSLCPTWEAVLQGQVNLRDAVRGTITYEHPTKGTYRLNPTHATLFVRPRGLHLSEAHATVDGEVIPASLFDWGLYMWHNAKELSFSRRRPYFYLPKLEHWYEARWWDHVLSWGEDRLELQRGACRATVLIETLPAAFQMNEILWALRDHSVGLNCGRWDYIFSYIKCFSANPQRITPDRSLITMEETFMSSYSSLLIDTCHRRGCHAMGGMAAQIPVKDPLENTKAMNRVRDDKIREVVTGHDGTWVAHPGLVQLATEIFDVHMPMPNQVDYRNRWCALEEGRLTEHLTQAPEVSITQQGLRQNVDVGVRYLAAWLNGQGCVPLYNLMEDAATAEISRTQVWQWLRHQAMDNLGQVISIERLEGELSYILAHDNNTPELASAVNMFREFCLAEELPEFLTLAAYDRITSDD